MDHQIIQGTNSVVFNPTVRKYLQEPGAFEELIPIKSRPQLLAELNETFAKSTGRRAVLKSALQKQYSRLQHATQFAAVEENIEALGEEDTYVVCTGQQIHPFMGPLFVFYKIWSCIDQSRKWKEQFPDKRFVPIFWMASEDHDFEEIKNVRLYGDVYSWEINATGPVGRLSTEGLLAMLDQLEQRADPTPEHTHFFSICRTAYSRYAQFADASRYLFHELFGAEGLVIIDPDDRALKQLFIPHIEADILREGLLEPIRNNIAQMKSMGITAPINGRPINHFYIRDGLRERIQYLDGAFRLLNESKSFSPNEMREEIINMPERFSPNALLRPLYQQSILPCVSYICGGGELLYWLELGELFRKRNEVYPELKLRNSSFIIGSGILKKVQKENIELNDLFLSESTFIERFASRQIQEFHDIQSSISRIKSELDFLRSQFENFDNSSEYFRTFKSMERKLTGFEDDAGKTLENKAINSGDVQHAMKLRNKILGNPLQERHDHCVRFIDILLKLNNPSTRPKYWDPADIHIFITG